MEALPWAFGRGPETVRIRCIIKIGQTNPAPASSIRDAAARRTTSSNHPVRGAAKVRLSTVGSHPVVSIITPTLNPGWRIRRCIKSVMQQTYPCTEHIIVDGGSTDGTQEILTRFRHLRWTSEADPGQAAAINKGFRLAEGEIVTWLNADDVLLRDAVEHAVGAFKSGGDEVGLAYGDCEVVADGRHLLTWKPPRILDMRSFESGSGIPQPGTFFAASAVRGIGYLDESFNFAMDVDLWLRLLERGVRTVYLPRVLSVFEIHSASKSGTISRSEFVYEEARALLRRGRYRAAGVALGRSAAMAAVREGVVNPEPFSVEVRRAVRRAREWDERIPERAVRAGAYAEAAVLELRRSAAGARHLLHREPWLLWETRARLRAAARRGARRHLVRLNDRPLPSMPERLLDDLTDRR